MTQIDHSLTFEQREGTAPLPTQFALQELPQSIRAPLWALIHGGLTKERSDFVVGEWSAALRTYWVLALHKDVDTYSEYTEHVISWIKPIVMKSSYDKCLGFIEHCIRHFRDSSRYSSFITSIDITLKSRGAAYRVVDSRSIAPISTAEEASAINDAINVLKSSGYNSAKTHLLNAASALSAGRFADSIRESIHAVESVARRIDPSSDTLSPALTSIERRGHLHPALKKGFASIYGYTSDEGGIRHALLEGNNPNVTESDAMYMFGACASFAAYLHRNTGG